MKKLLLSLILIGSVLSSFAQSGSVSYSGVFLRVNDTTAYQTAAATKHSQGYADTYWNNQATTPHYDRWNGSTYEHIFENGSGSGSVISVTGDGVDNTDPANPIINLTASRTITSSDDLDQTDNVHIVYTDCAAPCNVTVDLLTTGSQVTVWNVGAATATLIAGSGVTLSSTPIAPDEIAFIVYEPSATPKVRLSSGTVSGGTVTSVGFTGGLISVATPTTTPALTVAGTSGGVPYFSSSSTWASSAVMTANALVIGGGAGAAPATTTTGTGVVTALGVNVGSAGAVVVNGGALGTPSSATLTNATGLPVAGGGTGVASLTAYAPIFGGTTSTGAVQSGTAGSSGQVLTSNGAGVLPTFQTLAASSTALLTVTAQQYTFSDNEVAYFGSCMAVPAGSGGFRIYYVADAATITGADIFTHSGTAGTSEGWSIYVRVNNTTDYLIETVSASTAVRRFDSNALSVSLSPNDFFELKIVCPTWATNPAPTIIGGYVKLSY